MTMIELLILHEGLKLKPYRCTAGKLTIGIGRNLDDVGITESEAHYLAENDLWRVRMQLDHFFPWRRTLDPVRQMVLMDMCFNLGIGRFCSFSRTLTHVKAGEYDAASKEMLDSLWASQVGQRAQRLSAMMRTASVEV